MARPRTHLEKSNTSLDAVEGIWRECVAYTIKRMILGRWMGLTWPMGRNSVLRFTNPPICKPYWLDSQSAACPTESAKFSNCEGQFFQVCMCVCLCHMCMGLWGGQKKVSDPLRLEWQAALSGCCESEPSRRASARSDRAISQALQFFFFFFLKNLFSFWWCLSLYTDKPVCLPTQRGVNRQQVPSSIVSPSSLWDRVSHWASFFPTAKPVASKPQQVPCLCSFQHCGYKCGQSYVCVSEYMSVCICEYGWVYVCECVTVCDQHLGCLLTVVAMIMGK